MKSSSDLFHSAKLINKNNNEVSINRLHEIVECILKGESERALSKIANLIYDFPELESSYSLEELKHEAQNRKITKP